MQDLRTLRPFLTYAQREFMKRIEQEKMKKYWQKVICLGKNMMSNASLSYFRQSLEKLRYCVDFAKDFEE